MKKHSLGDLTLNEGERLVSQTAEEELVAVGTMTGNRAVPNLGYSNRRYSLIQTVIPWIAQGRPCRAVNMRLPHRNIQ